jgi:hypothetical protein
VNVSYISGVSQAYTDEAPSAIASREQVAGAHWALDWRDLYPVASDCIRNHAQPTFLGILDATGSVTDWNPWSGRTGPHPDTVIRHGYGTPGIQEYAQAAPLAIDTFDRHPDHGQNVLSGVSSIAALVPFIELPDAGIGTNDLSAGHANPYHFDYGLQLDMSSAIGPRQIFREPPSYGDQSAAVYAAGL